MGKRKTLAVEPRWWKGLDGKRIWQFLGARVVGGALFKKAEVVAKETKRRGTPV